MNYSIDFLKLIGDNSLHYLRTSFWLTWLFALLKPLRQINLSLVQFNQKVIYDTAFSPSVIYIEHVLNDLFDPSNRGITIVDGDNLPTAYTFFHTELGEVVFSWNESETALSGETYSFFSQEVFDSPNYIVQVPTSAGVSISDPQLIATINRYRPAGRTYSIVLI